MGMPPPPQTHTLRQTARVEGALGKALAPPTPEQVAARKARRAERRAARAEKRRAREEKKATEALARTALRAQRLEEHRARRLEVHRDQKVQKLEE